VYGEIAGKWRTAYRIISSSRPSQEPTHRKIIKAAGCVALKYRIKIVYIRKRRENQRKYNFFIGEWMRKLEERQNLELRI
jgi:hypothetical protein